MWMRAGVCSSSAKEEGEFCRILRFCNGIVCLHCRSLYQTWRMENWKSTQRCLEREEVPGTFKLNGRRLQICHSQNRQMWFFWLQIKGNITALPTGGACMHCRSVFKEPKLISSRAFVLLSMETIVLWNDAIIISFFFPRAGYIVVSLQQQRLCLQRMLITLVWSHTDRARTRMGLICTVHLTMFVTQFDLPTIHFQIKAFILKWWRAVRNFMIGLKVPYYFPTITVLKETFFYRRL